MFVELGNGGVSIADEFAGLSPILTHSPAIIDPFVVLLRPWTLVRQGEEIAQGLGERFRRLGVLKKTGELLLDLICLFVSQPADPRASKIAIPRKDAEKRSLEAASRPSGKLLA